mgnify:CR=1 FL=1
MVRQKKAPAARRRPMSREEALARQERQQRRRELEQESRELAKGPIDLPFFILVMLLTGVGLVMLLSASFPSAYYETDGQNPMSYFIRQGVFAIMGVAAMLFIGKINYQRFRGLAKPLLYLAVILLILVIVPGNPLAITRNNATRWLGIPGTSLQFQPSEIAKLAVVIYFADSISKKKDLMRTFRYGIAPYAIILVAVAGLVGLEPHLSGAMLILGAGAVLMLEMPADLVDVNVHPAKTEIRFAKESDVFDAVYRAVRTALATPGSGECRFEMGHTASEAEQTTMQPTAPAAPAAQPAAQHRPALDKNRFTTLSAAEYRALAGLAAGIPAKEVPGLTVVDSPKPVYKTSAGAAPQPLQGQPPRPVTYQAPSESVLDILPEPEGEPAQPAALQQEVPAQTTPKPEAEAPVPEEADYVVNDPHALSALPDVVNTTPEQTAMTPPPESEPLRLVGEVFKTYIITERAGELCLIDKHAAHERILFEQLAKDYGNVPAQMLLVPVQVNLTAAEKQAVLQNIDLLTDAGIEVEDFGGATVVVRAVPADVPVDDVEDMIIELAARLIDGARDALREKTEWVLHSIACRAAIKAGDKTGAAEMLALAQHIMDGTIPPFCPHGRPCVLKITRKELEKQFGRLV